MQGKWQISAGGGISPVWSPDGQELFYTPDRSGFQASRLMVVPVQTESMGTAAAPEALFSLGGYFSPGVGRHYDISPDGQRFLFLKPAEVAQTSEDAPLPQLVLVLNWFEELKERVPVP